MSLNDIVAREIRRRREEKGWSIKELARKIGASSSATTVSGWERGERLPNAHFLCQLADVFECSVDELLGRK